ncbi:MAG: hypothetical protein KGY49_11400 [Wenzhouxiangellaceae bacterium]|nr:hypothetical protein [Wenzhouxiangellaceae bacterium]
MYRVSAPDANSCGGCHNLPRSGGSAELISKGISFGTLAFNAGFGTDEPGRGLRSATQLDLPA